MILFSGKWTKLDVSCGVFCEIAHDAVLLLEFAYQDSEVKLQLNSPKYFKEGELKVLSDEGFIPYCLKITGIESMALKCNGHSEIYVEQLEQGLGYFKILGSNGSLSFSGRHLGLVFLRDDQSFSAIRALDQ